MCDLSTFTLSTLLCCLGSANPNERTEHYYYQSHHQCCKNYALLLMCTACPSMPCTAQPSIRFSGNAAVADSTLQYTGKSQYKNKTAHTS